jgi:hypothetical protein
MSTINPPASSSDITGQTRTQPTESELAAAAAMLPMICGTTGGSSATVRRESGAGRAY